MVGAHLWKRILNGGINRHVCGDLVQIAEPAIIRSTIIVDSRPEQSGECFRPATRTIAIPFDNVWVEYPSSLPPRGEQTGRRDITEGCLFISNRHKEGFAVKSYSVAETLDYGIVLVGMREFDVDASGKPAAFRKVTISDRIVDSKWAISQVDRICYIACETLELLACKNVGLSDRDNDPEQVKCAIKRHGGTPDSYRYHTLIVRPPGSKGSNSPGIDIGMMPRHVCRGHFAEYGPEFNKGLLFGKYAGRFFIPPCLKGDKKNGIVEKDYVIPPSTPAGGAIG